MLNSFFAYIRRKWVDLCQTKTKMIIGLFYTYRRIHFTRENVLFFWCFSLCLYNL